MKIKSKVVYLAYNQEQTFQDQALLLSSLQWEPLLSVTIWWRGEKRICHLQKRLTTCSGLVL